MTTTALTQTPAASVTRNTWKGHGRPARLVYCGPGHLTAPEPGQIVDVETGNGNVIFVKDGQKIDHNGAAGKFWAAPAPVEPVPCTCGKADCGECNDGGQLDAAPAKAAPAKASRPSRNAKLRPCLCGCKAQVKGLYKQGHDARHAGDVARKAIAAGADADLTAILAELPTEALQAKAAKMVAKVLV